MPEVITGCSYDCGGSCPLEITVEGGRMRRIGPDPQPETPEHPQLRPCIRGLSQVQRVYHPDRLLYPLKRMGARGEGMFQRIAWDEALDTVSGEIKRIQKQHGPQAILGLRGAGNTDGLLHGTGRVAERFFNAIGGQTATRAIISFEGALFASRHSFGFAPPPPGAESVLQSRLIILWGMNPSESVQATNTNWYLAQAKERGARFVFVDPILSESGAALADRWLAPLPGTDTAMLIALACVIIQEELWDKPYVDRYTFGFEAFRDYCLGTSDGIPKTPAWAEAICGVPAADIAALAREYATTKPAELRGGWAPGRTAFGEQFHHACIALQAITGNIGIPGGGPGAYIPQNNQRALGVSYLPPFPNPGNNASVVGWRWADAVLKGKAGGYPADIKMVYSLGGNRLNQCADTNRGVQALKQVEFVVVQDQMLTPMARYADILLPASTHFEREDIQGPHEHGHYLIYNHRAIAPLGESRSDLEICAALAERLGVKGFNDKSDQEWLAEFLAQAPVSAQALRQQGVWKGHPKEPEVPLYEFIADPNGRKLRTPSGKIEIYSQTIAQAKNPLLPPVPQYLPAWEGPQHPLAKKYPLLLVTAHSRKRVHSTFDNIPWLRELEPHTVWLNPADAKARGIKDGDLVKVYNDIGTMALAAKVTERIRPGAVNVYQGAWFQPDAAGIDRGGNVNTVCKDTISPAECSATNAVLVEVAKE